MKKNRKPADEELIKEVCRVIEDISKRQYRSFTDENNFLLICCENPEREPREIADRYNAIYGGYRNGGELNGDRVISRFRRLKLNHFENRKKLLAESPGKAAVIADLLSGKKQRLHELESFAAEPETHSQEKRLILLLAVDRSPEILGNQNAYQAAMSLNKEFASECLEGIISAIREKYGQPTSATLSGKLTPEEYKKKISQLENERNSLEKERNRANNLLRTLQESFDAQLAESKAEEQAKLMAMLNDKKYGYLLDMLISAKRAFKSLRSRKEDIPYELLNLQTLVRRILEFVEDCGVTQTMEAGEKLTVRASDIENFTYDGRPFANESEEKTVEVISPGWKIESMDIVISHPRVKETEEA